MVGLERSGLASLELLKAHGAQLKATDARALLELPAAADVLRRLDVPFEPQTPAAFEGCDQIVVSPGVPADLPPLEAARRRGVDVIGEVELAGKYLQGKIIGITGSNGKTTTTALVGHILREAGIPAQVGGNIGTAVTGIVSTSRPDQWNVLELSSFQLETIRTVIRTIPSNLLDTESLRIPRMDFVGWIRFLPKPRLVSFMKASTTICCAREIARLTLGVSQICIFQAEAPECMHQDISG